MKYNLAIMNRNEVCVATITWARDENEEAVLIKSLQALASLDLPVLITDGGSGAGLLDYIQSVPHFTLVTTPQKGVFAQARNSLAAACSDDVPFIFYTEPDKETFFRAALGPMLDEIKSDENLGVYLAGRTETAFQTFPSFQQMTETTINHCCAEVTGEQIDYTYGPFLLNKKLVNYLDLVKEDLGWGWRPFVFNIAHRLGLKISSLNGEFSCPPEQANDHPHERIYRMKQLEQNIRGIVASTEIALNHP